MTYQFFKESLEGYYLNASGLFVAKLTATASSCTIESLEHNPDENKKGAIVACAFSSTKTLVRPLELALVKSKDINATFAYEAEPLLPYPLEKCIVDKVRISKDAAQTKLQVFAALKEDLKESLEQFHEKGIDPEVLCPKPLALCHFAHYFLDKETPHLLIDIDAAETTIVCTQNGLPLFCRSLPQGLDALALQGELKDASDPLSELHQFFREIARILLSFQNELPDLPLLFTGQIVESPALMDLLSEFLKRPLAQEVALPATIRFAKPYSWQEICQFAVPIGAATSHVMLQKEMLSVNFRKEELAFTDKWLRWKKELTVYFSLMLLIAVALFTIGEMSLEKGRLALVERYAELLVTLEKPAIKLEQEYAKALGETAPQSIDITTLSSQEIRERLFFLEKEFSTLQEELALHPDVPRVSDLLAWLSTHPKVVDGLKLENLHYTMVKRPEKGKLKERYAVRVDLEFSSSNPTQAREFHDALLTPNPFVDAKNELKWSVQNGRFRANFFLKDRTQYPHSIAQGERNAGN